MVRISENVTAQYDLILLYINGKVQLGWCFFSFFFAFLSFIFTFIFTIPMLYYIWVIITIFYTFSRKKKLRILEFLKYS